MLAAESLQMNCDNLLLTFDKAPVCLARWKLRSKLCKCRKTFRAIRLIECCATFANTAFLNSLKPAAPALATPSVTL